MDTPPSSSPGRRSSIDSLDDMEDYFANYVPLSSLPTPPEPTMVNDQLVERKMSYDVPIQTNELQGPAIHLANLVPSGVCLHRPSPTTIHSYLTQHTLPLETLALAGCILDALSPKFARRLREAFVSASCPIPSVPEVVVLAALALATSYNHDEHLRASHWTGIVALGAVTTKQFNVASRCVLVDIRYGLHAFTAEMVEETLRDMQRAGQSRCSQRHSAASFFTPSKVGLCQRTVEANGLMTPEPTPP